MIFSTDGRTWRAACSGDGWQSDQTFADPEDAHQAARDHAAEPKGSRYPEEVGK